MKSFNPGDPTSGLPPSVRTPHAGEMANDSDELAGPTIVDLLSLAAGITASRARRCEHLSADLFAEPAWDMMMALFIADAEGRRMTVTNLTEASGVPASTALRWIERLVELGLAERKKNMLDARVVFIELQPVGRTAMYNYLSQTWTVLYGHVPKL